MAHDSLILASSSPRRRELLREWGYGFDVIPPRESAEDAAREGELPQEVVARLAFQKARDVALRIERGIVIGCDTVAECSGQILGKPVDRNDAWRMLDSLRGQKHRVFSGVCLWQRPADRHAVSVETTTLVMDALSDRQLEVYLATDAWQGKAGAFGFQDGLDWVSIVEGSESNVVGLPMELLARMLAGLPPLEG